MAPRIDDFASLCVPPAGGGAVTSAPQRFELRRAARAFDPLPLVCPSPDYMDAWVATFHQGHRGSPCPPVDIYRIPDLTLAAGGNLYLGDRLIADPALLPHWYLAHFIDAVGAQHGDDLDRPERVIESPRAVLFGHGCRVYGHALMEVLPQVHFLTGFCRPVPKIMVEVNTPKWFFDVLRDGYDLGPDAFDFYDPATERILLRDAIVPSLTHAGTEFHPANNEVYDRLKMRPSPARLDLRRAFLVRSFMESRYGSNRELDNEMELGRIAAREFGLTILCPETFSWPDQIALFSNLRVCIGQFGSALHNAVFAPPNCIVAAIGLMSLIQSHACALRRQRNAYVRTPLVAGHKTFTVDTDLFRRFVNEILIADRGN